MPSLTPTVAKVERDSGMNGDFEVGQQLTGTTPVEQPSHPLLEKSILDRLFEYCDWKALSQCRRVSKAWYKESLPHWLQRGPRLKLHLLNSIESSFRYKGSDELDGDDWKDMPGFLRLVDNGVKSCDPYEYAGLRQYTKFKIEGDLRNEVEHETLALFLKVFGRLVTDLSLTLTFQDLEMYQTLLLSKMTPNLVTLEADINFADADLLENGVFELPAEGHPKLTSIQIDYGRIFPYAFPLDGWTQLYKRYPNLQTLMFGINTHAHAIFHNDNGVDKMLEAFWNIRRSDTKLLNLKRLEICHLKTDNVLNSLRSIFRDSYLNLETFRYGIDLDSHTPNQTIWEVLESQAANLKKLIIVKDSPLKNFEPPRMDLVETLELHGHPFENLSFLRSFPGLKSLSFTFQGSNSDKLHLILKATKEEHLEGTTTPSLTKLHCNYNDIRGRICPEDIGKLRSCMPNVTDLQIWLDNASFRTTCQCWPRLQRLCIVGNEVDDEGITGIVPGEDIVSPNIKIVKDLKSLTMMHFNKWCLNNIGGVAITEKSLWEFLMMPKLEKLEVSLMTSMVGLDPNLLRRMKRQFKCITFIGARRRRKEASRTRLRRN